MPRLSVARTAPGEPPAPTDPQAQAVLGLRMDRMPGHNVRRLQQVAVRLFAECVGPELTPVQFAALVAMAQHAGMGQAELASRIGYDRATIGGVIDRLQARGLVRRVASREDRRQNLLTLTQEGLRIVAQSLPAVLEVQQRLLAPLDEAERETFERICRKLLETHTG